MPALASPVEGVEEAIHLAQLFKYFSIARKNPLQTYGLGRSKLMHFKKKKHDLLIAMLKQESKHSSLSLPKRQTRNTRAVLHFFITVFFYTSYWRSRYSLTNRIHETNMLQKYFLIFHVVHCCPECNDFSKSPFNSMCVPLACLVHCTWAAVSAPQRATIICH